MGKWVGSTEGENNVVVFELGCRKPVVGTCFAISVLFDLENPVGKG